MQQWSLKSGVDFDSLDGEPVTLLFLIAAPNTEDNVHLEVLSKLSMMLMDEQFTEALRNATSAEEFLSIIDKADDERADIDEQLADTGNAESDFKILAVTACPTGIAHTYMAAEGIEKAAKAADCFVKIETRGSGGAKKCADRPGNLLMQTALSLQQTHRFRWIVLTERK